MITNARTGMICDVIVCSVDPQPWLEVDLGQAMPIGTLRLWNRVQEPSLDEVRVCSVVRVWMFT